MDLYSTDELVDVIRDLKLPQLFLLRTFFRRTITSTSKKVHVDVEKQKRRMAPFVSPRSQGRVMARQGYQTNSIEPAYIKPKSVYDPEEAIEHREPGEMLTGELSPEERHAAWVVAQLRDHRTMIDRRMEWMAAQALVNGSITIVGEDYPTATVDFGRDASLEEALLGAAQWDQSTADPLNDLQTKSLATQRLSGAGITEWVMEPDAWALFTQNARVEKLLDTRRGGDQNRVNMAPAGSADAQFQGTIGPWAFWTYQDWVVDPETDVEAPLLPSGTVIGASDNLEGRQHYGAIRDPKASYRALPFFPKEWTEEDPPHTFLMSQVAPLVSILRPDASARLTVI